MREPISVWAPRHPCGGTGTRLRPEAFDRRTDPRSGGRFSFEAQAGNQPVEQGCVADSALAREDAREPSLDRRGSPEIGNEPPAPLLRKQGNLKPFLAVPTKDSALRTSLCPAHAASRTSTTRCRRRSSRRKKLFLVRRLRGGLWGKQIRSGH